MATAGVRLPAGDARRSKRSRASACVSSGLRRATSMVAVRSRCSPPESAHGCGRKTRAIGNPMSVPTRYCCPWVSSRAVTSCSCTTGVNVRWRHRRWIVRRRLLVFRASPIVRVPGGSALHHAHPTERAAMAGHPPAVCSESTIDCAGRRGRPAGTLDRAGARSAGRPDDAKWTLRLLRAGADRRRAAARSLRPGTTKYSTSLRTTMSKAGNGMLVMSPTTNVVRLSAWPRANRRFRDVDADVSAERELGEVIAKGSATTPHVQDGGSSAEVPNVPGEQAVPADFVDVTEVIQTSFVIGSIPPRGVRSIGAWQQHTGSFGAAPKRGGDRTSLLEPPAFANQPALSHPPAFVGL